MDPQLELLAGEKKLSPRMMERQRRMASAANIGDTKNIITDVPANPIRLVCHEKYLNDGLKKESH